MHILPICKLLVTSSNKKLLVARRFLGNRFTGNRFTCSNKKLPGPLRGIGTQTLDICRQFPGRFKPVALAAGRDTSRRLAIEPHKHTHTHTYLVAGFSVNPDQAFSKEERPRKRRATERRKAGHVRSDYLAACPKVNT